MNDERGEGGALGQVAHYSFSRGASAEPLRTFRDGAVVFKKVTDGTDAGRLDTAETYVQLGAGSSLQILVHPALRTAVGESFSVALEVTVLSLPPKGRTQPLLAAILQTPTQCILNLCLSSINNFFDLHQPPSRAPWETPLTPR